MFRGPGTHMWMVSPCRLRGNVGGRREEAGLDSHLRIMLRGQGMLIWMVSTWSEGMLLG